LVEAADAINPAFASTMTLNHWKLYNNDETLDMFRKAEYMANKQQDDIDDNVAKGQAAADNLDDAKRYLKQAENTIVKLTTELNNFTNQNDEASK